MISERQVKQIVKRILTRWGAYWMMPATGGYGESGALDIYACWDGTFIAIECKAPGKGPTNLQMKVMRQIANANGLALWTDEDDEVKAEVKLLFVFLNRKRYMK